MITDEELVFISKTGHEVLIKNHAELWSKFINAYLLPDMKQRFSIIYDLILFYKISEEEVLSMTHEERITYSYLFKEKKL